MLLCSERLHFTAWIQRDSSFKLHNEFDEVIYKCDTAKNMDLLHRCSNNIMLMVVLNYVGQWEIQPSSGISRCNEYVLFNCEIQCELLI